MFDNSLDRSTRQQIPIDSLVSPGIYKHYKGAYYSVLCVSMHTETGEQCVVYQSLYGDFSVWSRPRDMFVSTVEYNGVVQPRFIKVAEPSEAEKFVQRT